VLKAWLRERAGTPEAPLFPTSTGKRLSRDAIEHRLAIHLKTAATSCPSITTKHITMHTLRHTAAMRLLLAGNDITVSRSGSATSRSPPPRSTYTPT
jgi:site-specific recombinase XerD